MKAFLKLVRAIAIVTLVGVVLYKVYEYFAGDDIYEEDFDDEDFDLDSEMYFEEEQEDSSLVGKLVDGVVGVVDSVSCFLADKLRNI